MPSKYPMNNFLKALLLFAGILGAALVVDADETLETDKEQLRRHHAAVHHHHHARRNLGTGKRPKGKSPKATRKSPKSTSGCEADPPMTECPNFGEVALAEQMCLGSPEASDACGVCIEDERQKRGWDNGTATSCSVVQSGEYCGVMSACNTACNHCAEQVSAFAACLLLQGDKCESVRTCSC